MSHHETGSLYFAVSLLACLSLVSAAAAPPAVVRAQPAESAAAEAGDAEPSQPDFDAGLFRARIVLRNPPDLERVQRMGVTVLESGGDWALVVATGAQLADLARLGFRPRAADSLESLGFGGREPLSATETDALARAPSSDSDGDGLTDTEEAWWCTDPANPNSDSDAHGYTDGQEVAALLDFTLPRSVRWGYGPPFGPPAAWPDWNGADGNPATPACNDGDYDTIPDYAEVYVVGSQVPEETTDHDKFDDGQELFGVTYCPGAPTSCGYGNYPRIEYWNYIKATMPTWVRPPGDNLFVAAFPVPEVYVVPGSWTVERVTTITTQEGAMAETTHSYETSITRGQSTSIANTVTWNEWEEVSEAVETPLGRGSFSPRGFWDRAKGAAKIVGGVVGLGVTGMWCASTFLGCAAAGVAAIPLSKLVESGWNELWAKDDVQAAEPVNVYDSSTASASASASAEAQASAMVVNNLDFQGVTTALDGVQYAMNRQSELLSQGLHDISYQLSRPRLTETRTNGRSWGGAQTVTNEEYEEHTIAEGEAFTSGENWSTAWAVDSSHAADLTFNFRVENSGTEYAREIAGLMFNIYLGDDADPLISYPAWEQFAGGTLQNVFPGDVHPFASDPVPLTLEQMKRIDLGERLVVVLEDYSYGADELFYQDAVNGGVTVFVEDGVEDGDELVDMYVVPTWGVESVQDVLTRYFPHGEDDEGNLNALWTPEFDGINPPDWYEHYLSDIAWWNIYQTCQPAVCADVGATPLHEQEARAGSAVLFRFNRDSDRDGYQDRVELKYGTGPNDPASHPQPEVLAGYTATRVGDEVTVLLKLANLGTFDAYGIDAVMYAPDDTVTIGNNYGGQRPGPAGRSGGGGQHGHLALPGWLDQQHRQTVFGRVLCRRTGPYLHLYRHDAWRGGPGERGGGLERRGGPQRVAGAGEQLPRADAAGCRNPGVGDWL